MIALGQIAIGHDHDRTVCGKWQTCGQRVDHLDQFGHLDEACGQLGVGLLPPAFEVEFVDTQLRRRMGGGDHAMRHGAPECRSVPERGGDGEVSQRGVVFAQREGQALGRMDMTPDGRTGLSGGEQEIGHSLPFAAESLQHVASRVASGSKGRIERDRAIQCLEGCRELTMDEVMLADLLVETGRALTRDDAPDAVGEADPKVMGQGACTALRRTIRKMSCGSAIGIHVEASREMVLADQIE